MKYRTYLLFFALIFSTQLWSQTETCLQNLTDPDNRIISQVIGSDTILREYILHIPSNYEENTPAPLIINLHGFGDCASDYAKSIGDFYNFTQLANEENIIVAYPQGAYRPEKEDTYWEPGDSGVENIYESDVYFIEELILILSAEFNLNPDMIYACGYSNGGMMAYSLACNRANLFSAVGIMSGTMLQEDCNVEKPVPIIKFHGIADEVLPYNGSFWYQSVEEVVDFWLDQNGIPAGSLTTTELNGGNVVHDKYSGGDENSCLSLYTINEEFDKPGDHVWFSEEIEGATPNRILWNFFVDNCGTVNSTDESKKEPFVFYPNPVKHWLEVENAINQEYSIYDLYGKLVLSGKINSNEETINLEHLQNGYFTIRIGEQINKLLKVD